METVSEYKGFKLKELIQTELGAIKQINHVNIGEQLSRDLIAKCSSQIDFLKDKKFILDNIDGVLSNLAYNEQKVGLYDIPEDLSLWFIGDMHGDLLAFNMALDTIKALEKDNPYKVVFLGDVIDRGPHMTQLISMLFYEISQNKDRYAVLAGNHDIGLAYNNENKNFFSLVSPSEFINEINEQLDISSDFAQNYIKFSQKLPYALFFKGGLMVSHGGFPLSDTWEDLKEFKDLEKDICLNDFAWQRLKESKKVNPNRDNDKGWTMFGAQDFEYFSQEKMKELCQESFSFWVRGHDHVITDKERLQIYFKNNGRGCFGGKVMTINNMSFRLDQEYSFNFKGEVRSPAIVKWEKGSPPIPHILNFSAEDPELAESLIKQYSSL